jgi:hypothetical protein
LANGSSVEFIARSEASGLGFTVDALVLDEAKGLSGYAIDSKEELVAELFA